MAAFPHQNCVVVVEVNSVLPGLGILRFLLQDEIGWVHESLAKNRILHSFILDDLRDGRPADLALQLVLPVLVVGRHAAD